jgi:ribulose-phosphate 3-epimerase
MHERSVLITPSILSANLGRLQEEIDSIASADWIQVDVMDGHFVPNLTFGAPVLACIRTSLPLDIHLMVTNPADRVQEFIDVGVKHITFHAEAVERTSDRVSLIKKIRSGGATAGIALNPATELSAIEDIVSDIDLVLIMSVVPGFSGQTFRAEVLEKVSALHARFPKRMIQMDGGIDARTAPLCVEAGAHNLVSASYIFSAKDRAAAIHSLRSL